MRLGHDGVVVMTASCRNALWNYGRYGTRQPLPSHVGKGEGCNWVCRLNKTCSKTVIFDDVGPEHALIILSIFFFCIETQQKLCPIQFQTLGLEWSSCLSLLSSWDIRHKTSSSAAVIFIYVIISETKFYTFWIFFFSLIIHLYLKFFKNEATLSILTAKNVCPYL